MGRWASQHAIQLKLCCIPWWKHSSFLELRPLYCCVTILPHTQWLKITYVIISKSVVQSQASLSWVFFFSPHKSAFEVMVRAQFSSERLTEKKLSSSFVLLADFSSFCVQARRLELLLNGDNSQHLFLISQKLLMIPCPIGSPTMATCFLGASNGERDSKKTGATVICNHVHVIMCNSSLFPYSMDYKQVIHSKRRDQQHIKTMKGGATLDVHLP